MNRRRDIALEEEELEEFHIDPVDALPDPEGSIDSVEPKRRGRPAIPISWTRVLYFDHSVVPSVQMYQLAPDILLEKAMPFIGPAL
jgi:hypothetical protein